MMQISFSVPIFRLKREARLLARKQNIQLHQALDQISVREGYRAWSELAAKHKSGNAAARLKEKLQPGQLVVFGARRGHGKTRLALEVLVKTVSDQRPGFFFTLDYVSGHFVELLHDIGIAPQEIDGALKFCTSDDITAAYITKKVEDCIASPTRQRPIVLIDYLQLLDQKRSNPAVQNQLVALKEFAQRKSATVIVLSQIDRQFEESGKSMPELSDLRQPNPFDLSIFDTGCFLHEGKVEVMQL